MVLYKEEGRQSLGSRFDWREMLRWADGMGPLLTRRAYSGFCLIYLGSQAARQNDWRGLAVLLGRAFAKGAPTARQVLPFLAFWVLPFALRQRVRGWVAVRRRQGTAAAC